MPHYELVPAEGVEITNDTIHRAIATHYANAFEARNAHNYLTIWVGDQINAGREKASVLRPQLKLRIVGKFTADDLAAAIARESKRVNTRPLPDWFPNNPMVNDLLDQFPDFDVSSSYPYYPIRETRTPGTSVAYSRKLSEFLLDRQQIVHVRDYLMAHTDKKYTRTIELEKDVQRYFLHYNTLELRIAATPEEAIQVYTNRGFLCKSSTVSSCMTGDHKSFGLPKGMHPVLAYVGPDSTLAVAYIVNTTENVVVGRVVISPKSKIYVRIYAVSDHYNTAISEYLKTLGYRQVPSYKGERLHLFPVPNSKLRILMPYVDGSISYVNPDGLITDDGNDLMTTTITCGYTLRSRYTCDGCGTDSSVHKHGNPTEVLTTWESKFLNYSPNSFDCNEEATSSTISAVVFCRTCMMNHGASCMSTGWTFDKRLVDHINLLHCYNDNGDRVEGYIINDPKVIKKNINYILKCDATGERFWGYSNNTVVVIDDFTPTTTTFGRKTFQVTLKYYINQSVIDRSTLYLYSSFFLSEQAAAKLPDILGTYFEPSLLVKQRPLANGDFVTLVRPHLIMNHAENKYNKSGERTHCLISSVRLRNAADVNKYDNPFVLINHGTTNSYLRQSQQVDYMQSWWTASQSVRDQIASDMAPRLGATWNRKSRADHDYNLTNFLCVYAQIS